MEKYSRINDVVDGALEENLVMMHVENGKYFGLNTVGKCIWELLEQPKTLNEIVDSLLTTFEVTPEQCLTEVKMFLDEMEKADVVKKGWGD